MSFSLAYFSTARDGARIAYPNENFWSAWRESKDSLKAKGFSVTKDDKGTWVVKHYPQNIESNPVSLANGYELRDKSGLLPYQVAPAGQIVAQWIKLGASLDGSDPGTGKTYVALAAARELGLYPLVICPMTVAYAWERAGKAMGVRILAIVNWEGARSKGFPYGAMGADKEYRFKNLPKNVIIFFDEAHKAKGEETINSKMVIGARRQGLKRHLMTATIATKPPEMRAAGYALNLHNLFDYNQWLEKLGCFKNKWRGWECADTLSAMASLNETIFPGRGVRIKISDLGDAFPETKITAAAYQVEGAEEQNEQYEFLQSEVVRLQHLARSAPALAAKAAKLYEEWEKAPSASTLHLWEEYEAKVREARQAKASIMTLNLRYRQMSESKKVKLLIELAKEYIEAGLSVAIFVNYIDNLEAIQSALKCPVIRGEQDDKERDQAREAFQSDAARAIVCQIQAGGVGLSLHDLRGDHPRMALIAPTYSAQELKQVLGRVHRAGGLTKSQQRVIYAAGTVEEKEVMPSVALKLSNLAALNDGDVSGLPEWVEEEVGVLEEVS